MDIYVIGYMERINREPAEKMRRDGIVDQWITCDPGKNVTEKDVTGEVVIRELSRIQNEIRQRTDCGLIPMLLSDDRKTVAVVKADPMFSDVCCIGIADPENNIFFDGAFRVYECLEEIDRKELKTAGFHFAGVPVQIAETEHLVIRESIPEDFEELFRISREPGNDSYTETMSEDRGAEYEKFRSYVDVQYRFYEYGLWTVLLKENGSVIGRCGLMPMRGSEQETEIGYLIGSAYRGNGYAKEACKAIIAYAKEELQMTVLYARIRKENRISQNLAEKLGFEQEEEMLWKLML